MDENTKQSVKDAFIAGYLAYAIEAVRGKKISVFDMIENDFGSWLSGNSEEIPNGRRENILGYTESAFIQGAETKDGMTKMFLKDINRSFKLSSEIHRKSQ